MKTQTSRTAVPHVWLAAVLVGAGLTLTPLPATAQLFVATGRDTLRALPGVEVAVEEIDPVLERAGFTPAAVRALIQSELREAGITVYATQRENPSPAKAYVYVDVNPLTLPDGSAHAVALQVQLRQTLRSLVTESSIVDAVTWDTHTVVLVPSTQVVELKAEVREALARFVRDWRAAHAPARR